MFDFLFRRGNPSNSWSRTPNLDLQLDLAAPSLNGIRLGDRFDRLCVLGRSDTPSAGELYYFDLGLCIVCSSKGTLSGFSCYLQDEHQEIQPFQGGANWKDQPLNLGHLKEDDLVGLFGDWYWMDRDEDESIAFYEFPEYEMQIELDLSGTLKCIHLSNAPLMADAEQRRSYGVDKPWPPEA